MRPPPKPPVMPPPYDPEACPYNCDECAPRRTFWARIVAWLIGAP